jgi:hypothetical protein
MENDASVLPGLFVADEETAQRGSAQGLGRFLAVQMFRQFYL